MFIAFSSLVLLVLSLEILYLASALLQRTKQNNSRNGMLKRSLSIKYKLLPNRKRTSDNIYLAVAIHTPTCYLF
ncbi:MAG: hypothetical protein D3925_18645 [Candidatus Electrothrix sp. AR5]|nr:hypothetical protein [Candidatus Electrothrix sp. AR5]